MLENARVMTVLPAHDLQRAVMFYRDTLGMSAEPSGDGMEIAFGGGSFFIYQTANAGTAKNTAMTFLVADIDAEVAALRRRGVVFEEYDFPGLKTINGIADLQGERAAWFKDSERNIIAITQYS
jgi:predicted enzyme related to lactoylglutathione lyase